MTEATSIGAWIQSAVTILGFILLWRKVCNTSEKREITPQPLEVREAKQFSTRDHEHVGYVTDSYCQRQHASADLGRSEIMKELKEIRKEISNMSAAVEKSAEERASKLHQRIDPISNAVATVNGRVDDHLEDHRAGRV